MASNLFIDLGRSIVANALNSPNSFDRIYDMTYGRSTTPNFFQFVQSISKGRTKRANHEDGKVEVLRQFNQYVQAEIASTVLSGSNIVLTLSDATYDFFRNDFEVMDKNRKGGIVIAHSPGSVTLAPLPGESFTLATDFVAGTYAVAGATAMPSRGSTGTESLYTEPERDYNYTRFMRESVFMSRKDLQTTYLNDSGNMVSSYQEQMAAARFAYQLDYNAIFGKRGKGLVNGQTVQTNGGLYWAIQNRGGLYQSESSLPTLATYKRQLEFIRDNSNQPTGQVLWVGGTKARARFFDTVGSSAITNVGKNATFGTGFNTGLDITTFQWLGLSHGFIDLPLFNDPSFNQNISNISGERIFSDAFFVLNLSDVPDINGGMAPPVQVIHFDETAQINYGFVPGTVGANFNPGQATTAGKFMMASGIDGAEAHMWFDGGIDIPNAAGMTAWTLND